jgi:3-hydroxy-3-methylglutaryl CoA synthase
MAGIVAYGAYIPKLRLERKHIAQSWGIPGAPGEIAVGNFDEDSITMAVEAARDCLLDDPTGVGGLYFASTSAPYQEKACSTLVASVLDLPNDTVTADFASSLSAGMGALVAAVGAVNDGIAESILVTAAEVRIPEPKSADEQTLGDGAGAVLVGKGGVIAEIKGVYTCYDEILGSWRTAEDRRIREGNPRFFSTKGYTPGMAAALKGAAEKFGVTIDDLSKVVYAAPDFRSHQGIAKMMKLKPEEGKVQDAMFAFVGGCGCAQPIMMLAAALEEVKPGDRILLAGAGDAYNVLLLEVTDAIADLTPRRAIKGHLGSKQYLDSYAKFLRYRELIELEPIENNSSLIQMWRDRKAVLPLYGKKCNKCGTVYFPPRRVCPDCRTYDENEDIKLKKTGTLFNFIDDNLYPSEEPPTTLTITDLDGGGRIFLQMTDREVGQVELEMPVELVFRRIHEGGQFHNYFWKTRPVR